MRKYEEVYPSENVFFGVSRLTPEDIDFLLKRRSFFNGLKQDGLDILKSLESINAALKRVEDKSK